MSDQTMKVSDYIDTWTPGRVVEALERGWLLPEDWREILEASQYELPEDNE